MKKYLLKLMALTFLISSPLFAAEGGRASDEVTPAAPINDTLPHSGSLPEIIVTATKTPVPIDETIADVTVITQEEIEKSGAPSVADLLTRTPSIELSRNGGIGATTSIFMRGANSGHLLVLVDGVRVAPSSTGGNPFEAIPLSAIERIEIVRGAASMLYGADAVSGVIQIFTKRGDTHKPFSGDVDFACGSFATCASNARLSGKIGIARWSVALGGENARGVSAIDNPANFNYNPDRDGYQNRYQHANVTLTPSENHSVTLAFLRDSQKADIDMGGRRDDRSDTLLQQTSFSGNHHVLPFWRIEWLAAIRESDSITRSLGNAYRYETSGRELSLQNTFRLDFNNALSAVSGDLIVGAEYREEKLTGSTQYDKNQRDTGAALLAYRWTKNAHTLFASGRLDHTTQYGSKPTAGIHYGYAISDNWKVSTGFATAYKAPTFNDLYYPNYANPYLRPEKSETLEASVTHTRQLGDGAGDLTLKTTAWRTSVRDLIVIQCDAFYNCVPENVNRAEITGLNFLGDLRYHDYSALLSVDWQHPKDKKTGLLLPRRSKLHGNIQIGKIWGNFYAAINTQFSRHRFDDTGNTRKLGGYGVANLVAEWRQPLYDMNFVWFARVSNVFDKNYAFATDYPVYGRAIMIGARGSW